MLKLRHILLSSLVSLLQPMVLQGQERLLHLLVRDAEGDAALSLVHVNVVGTDGMHVTDASGMARLPVPVGRDASLQLSHVAYGTQRIDVPVGTEQLVVHMHRRAVELAAVDIARPAPELVYRHPVLHVADMMPGPEGLWVLVYERRRLLQRQADAGRRTLRDVRLALLDGDLMEVGGGVVPGEARALHRDHAGRVYLEAVDTAYRLSFDPQLGIVEHGASLTELFDAVLPWTDSIPGRLLGSNRHPAWPAFDHFAYDPEGDASQVICSIEDRHVMELFRSEYKYMSGADKVRAMNLERELGVDREIIAGFMSGFRNSPYFGVPYAPLFKVGDTLHVFDHVDGLIRSYKPCGTMIGAVVMGHQRERGYRQRLLQDPVDERVYAWNELHGNAWLSEVDPVTGATRVVLRMGLRYPEELKVYGGHAYYVHRAQGSTLARSLFREALR